MPARDPSPILIGPYEVTEIVAPGDCVALCLARHRLTGQDAGLRILRPALSDRADLVNHFAREVRMLARVQHPGVLAFTGLAGDNGVPFAIADPIFGRTMAQMLTSRETPLPEPAGLAMIYQLAEALAAVHADGQVHGALDLSCVLVTPDGSVLLLPHRGIRDEAGLPLVLTADALGEPNFHPPERSPGTAPTATGDVYALGMVARTALRPSETPPSVAALIERCVAPRAEDRPQLADVVAAIAKVSREQQPHTGTDLAALASVRPSVPPASDAPAHRNRRRLLMTTLASATVGITVLLIAAGSLTRGDAGAAAGSGAVLAAAGPTEVSTTLVFAPSPTATASPAPSASGCRDGACGSSTPSPTPAPTSAPTPTPEATAAPTATPSRPSSPALPLVARLAENDPGPLALLPVDAFAAEPERSIVEAINRANRVFIEADATGNADLLAQTYAGPVLEEFANGVRQLRQAGRRRIGSLQEIELQQIQIEGGDHAIVRTRERWRLETLGPNDRRIDLVTRWFEQRYELQIRDGRWLVVIDDILAEREA